MRGNAVHVVFNDLICIVIANSCTASLLPVYVSTEQGSCGRLANVLSPSLSDLPHIGKPMNIRSACAIELIYSRRHLLSSSTIAINQAPSVGMADRQGMGME
jgi:hypothetical protein